MFFFGWGVRGRCCSTTWNILSVESRTAPLTNHSDEDHLFCSFKNWFLPSFLANYFLLWPPPPHDSFQITALPQLSCYFTTTNTLWLWTKNVPLTRKTTESAPWLTLCLTCRHLFETGYQNLSSQEASRQAWTLPCYQQVSWWRRQTGRRLSADGRAYGSGNN